MQIAVIIQARMSSQRLPGKVLRPVADKPMLQYTLDRLRQSIHDLRLIVATSRETSDDPLEDYCLKKGTEIFRGALDDVAGRYAALVKEHRLPAFVRVTGDSPLIDTQLIDAGIDSFATGQFDMVSNVFPRSFPKGQSFEVLNADVFLEAVGRMTGPGEREHITQHFYRHPDKYRIYNVASNSGNYAEDNLSVDTEEDFERFRRLMEDPDRPVMDFGWEEILRIYKGQDSHECTN